MLDLHMEEERERWLPVPGFEGVFEVSSLGRLKSLPRKAVPRERILKPTICKTGYAAVNLNGNGKNVVLRVHTIVASAFHGDRPKDRAHAAHLNGNRADNRAENIIWVNPSENGVHRSIHRAERERGNHSTRVPVDRLVRFAHLVFANQELRSDDLEWLRQVYQSSIDAKTLLAPRLVG